MVVASLAAKELVRPLFGSADSLANYAYVDIRRRIWTGEIKPGSVLNTKRLAEELEISRTPIQLAMHMLSQAGLIEVKPHVGNFVTEDTVESLKRTFELRAINESAAVELALNRASDEQLQGLAESLPPNFSINPPTGDAEIADSPWTIFRLVILQDAFHLAIAQLAGNSDLLWLINLLVTRSHRALLRYARHQIEKGILSTPNEHRGIVDAMLARDKDLAVRTMREHIEKSFREVAAVL